MANGETCIDCDRYETDHTYRTHGGECDHFKSSFTHLDGCSVVGCDGDCEDWMERARIAHEKAEDIPRVYHCILALTQGALPEDLPRQY
ncbi:MAG: hypothetical protein ACI9H6_000694 [Patiriisocius sp.]|jgi:hypothetical protein